MKILIIGCVASGKSTLANRLSDKLSISYYEIDSIVHDDINKKKRNFHEQKDIIDKINADNNWIIEGMLRKNYYLFDYADKIVYLNISNKTIKHRILKRYLKQKFKIEKSNYKPSFEMLKMMYKWSDEFEKNKIELDKQLERYKNKLIVLKNNYDINEFINNME